MSAFFYISKTTNISHLNIYHIYQVSLSYKVGNLGGLPL